MGVWWDGPEYVAKQPLTQQETTMSSTSSDTLDGMTVTQLRDLAQRAENAAKVQEQMAENEKYVDIGEIDAWEWRVHKSTGKIEWRLAGDQLWHREGDYSQKLEMVVRESRPGRIDHMVEILKRVAERKRQGVLK